MNSESEKIRKQIWKQNRCSHCIYCIVQSLSHITNNHIVKHRDTTANKNDITIWKLKFRQVSKRLINNADHSR